jgi:NADH:ubiquinone oxidoreductase subunit 6 (subunit J)
MSQGNIFLYFFMFATFISVLVMLFTRTIFYAALALIGGLISVAGIYALLYAEFLAITQIVIYAGGILVLILFGIMLTNRITGKPLLMQSHHTFPGMIISMGIFFVLVVAYQKTSFHPMQTVLPQADHINQIGIALMSTYVAPFEIAGVLLLVCLIGAALMASSFNKNGNV